jgi:hypothetical protein
VIDRRQMSILYKSDCALLVASDEEELTKVIDDARIHWRENLDTGFYELINSSLYLRHSAAEAA